MEPSEAPPFERVGWGWFALLDGSFALLVLLVLRPSSAARLRSRTPIGSDRTLRLLVVMTLAAHFAEGAVAWRWARKKGLPPGLWAAQSAVVGFPSLLALRARAARNPEKSRGFAPPSPT